MFGTLKTTYTDGRETEYATKQSDAIRFERHFRKSAQSILAEVLDDNGNVVFDRDKDGNKIAPKMEIRVEYLWYFAYIGAMRDGEARTFDEWMDDVESVQVVTAPKEKPSPKTRSRSA